MTEQDETTERPLNHFELRLGDVDDPRIVIAAKSGDDAIRQFNVFYPNTKPLAWGRVSRSRPVTPLPLPTIEGES